jgi:hypothetical protein
MRPVKQALLHPLRHGRDWLRHVGQQKIARARASRQAQRVGASFEPDWVLGLAAVEGEAGRTRPALGVIEPVGAREWNVGPCWQIGAGRKRRQGLLFRIRIKTVELSGKLAILSLQKSNDSDLVMDRSRQGLRGGPIWSDVTRISKTLRVKEGQTIMVQWK